MKTFSYPDLLATLTGRLLSGRSGHFAVCANAGSDPRAFPLPLFDRLRAEASSASTPLLLLVFQSDAAPASRLRLVDVSGSPPVGLTVNSFYSFREVVEQIEPLSSRLLLVIESFERFSLNEQSDLLAALRSVRESAVSCFQLLLLGTWSPHAFFRYWRKERSHLSCPLDEGNIFRLGTCSLDWLRDAFGSRLRGNRSTVNCALHTLFEVTGGDVRFLRYVDSQLDHDDGIAPVILETLVFDMAKRADIQDSAVNACEGLTPSAQTKLEAVLRHQYLRTDREDGDAEELWRRGLIRPAEFTPSGPNEVTWEPSSPLLAECLRNCWPRLAPRATPMSVAGALLPLKYPAVADAMPLVWEIESMLRNLIQSRLPGRAGDSEPLSSASSVKVNGESVYRTALSLRDSDARDADLSLVRTPLSTFLDVGQLTAILTDSTLFETYFRVYFDKKESLTANLRRFNSIRNAVAHGKLVSCVALDRLVELRRWFGTCLTNAALRWTSERDQVRALRFDRFSTREFPLPENRGTRVQLTIRNLGDRVFTGLTFEVCTRGGLKVGEAGKQTSRPGEGGHFFIEIPPGTPYSVADLEVFLVAGSGPERLTELAGDQES